MGAGVEGGTVRGEKEEEAKDGEHLGCAGGLSRGGRSRDVDSVYLLIFVVCLRYGLTCM